jgi:hypothetical protein
MDTDLVSSQIKKISIKINHRALIIASPMPVGRFLIFIAFALVTLKIRTVQEKFHIIF